MGIDVTGAMRVVGPDGSVDAAGLPGRQGRIVLASLALAEHPVVRDVLAERVWGDSPSPAWERDLSALVSRLRRVLERAGVAATIRSERGSWQLVADPDLVDVRRARATAQHLRALAGEDRLDEVVARAADVTTVTTRPLLADEDAAWLDDARDELARLRRDALEASARAELALGRLESAREDVRTLLDLDPLHETAHRLRMRIEFAAGNRAGAVLAYDEVRRLLADQLGLDPAPATQRLHVEILRDADEVGAPSATPDATTDPVGTARGDGSVEGPDVDPPVSAVAFARTGGVSIAYQVVGDGPVDLVIVPGFVSNLDLNWQEPNLAAFVRRLARSCRVVLFDKRGTGLSDPMPLDEPPPLEVRMDDVRAVLDAVGSEHAVVFGFSEGGALSLLLAATHPDRVSGLVLFGCYARQMRSDDHPWGWSREQGLRRFARPIRDHGRPPLKWFGSSAAGDPVMEDWWARYVRQSASPGMAMALLRANAEVDLRALVPTVQVPALVMHRLDDPLVEVGQGRWLADHLPRVHHVEVDGDDHWPWLGDTDLVVETISRFAADPEAAVVDGDASDHDPTPGVLSTLVVVADGDPAPGGRPAGSNSERDGAGPDAMWGHTARSQRGRPVRVHGVARAATFDGPGRAVVAASRLVRADPSSAAAVHTGMVELHDDMAGGAAAELARAALDRSAPGQVVLTRTVVDLVAGWGLDVAPAGWVGTDELLDGLDVFRLVAPPPGTP